MTKQSIFYANPNCFLELDLGFLPGFLGLIHNDWTSDDIATIDKNKLMGKIIN
jgi:hypothetical protein